MASIATSIAAVSPDLINKGADYLKDLRKRAEANLTGQQNQSSTNPNLSQEDKQKAQQQSLYGTMMKMAAEDASSLTASSVAQGIRSTIGKASDETTKARESLVDVATAAVTGVVKGDATEFVAKTAEEYIAKVKDATQAAREAIDTNKEAWIAQKNVTDPDAKLPAEQTLSDILGIKAEDLNKISSRNTTYDLRNGTKEQKEALNKAIKEKGAVVGQDVISNGHIKLHDITSIANKKKEGDKEVLDGTYGEKSKLGKEEFIEGMAKFGFLTTDAKQVDAIMNLAQGLKDKVGDKLSQDGDSLALLYASYSKHTPKTADKPAGYQFDKSLAQNLNKDSLALKILNEGLKLEGKDGDSLRNVDKNKASQTAHEYNAANFANFAGKSVEESAQGLLSVGVDVAAKQMDQFSPAAYAVGQKDLGRIKDQTYKNQVKKAVTDNQSQGGITINAALSVGSRLGGQARNDYADVSRGGDLAALSQLTAERGLQANALNQISLVGHGVEGLMTNLQALKDFKEATGANINLDMALYTHSNKDGQLVLGTKDNPGAVLTQAQTDQVMGLVKDIVGKDNAAKITGWGCFQEKDSSTSTAFNNSKNAEGIGSLTVVGAEGIAYSSAKNLTSSDSTVTLKSDASGQLLTERVTTNGAQGETKVFDPKVTKGYSDRFEASTGRDITTQQVTDRAKEEAKTTNDKIAKLPGSNRADDNDPVEEEGEGSVNLSAAGIAEAKDRIKEEDKETA